MTMERKREQPYADGHRATFAKPVHIGKLMNWLTQPYTY